jgi:hypothetical protein
MKSEPPRAEQLAISGRGMADIVLIAALACGLFPVG